MGAGGNRVRRIQHGCQLTCQTCVNMGGVCFSVRKSGLTWAYGDGESVQFVVSQVQGIKALSMEIKAGRSITVGTKALSETIQYKYQAPHVIYTENGTCLIFIKKRNYIYNSHSA